MKIKYILVILGIHVCAVVCTCSQDLVDSRRGTLKVKIPRPAIISQTDDEHLTVLLKRETGYAVVPLKQRIRFTDPNYGEEYLSDEYAIELDPGLYRLQIREFDDYKLPNFRVDAGKTVVFQIPMFRFALETECKNDRMISPLYGEDTEARTTKAIKSVRQRKVATDSYVLEKPFEVVISHCGYKSAKNGILEFNSARLYYKNLYVAAAKLKLDKKKLILVANGDALIPIEVQFNGGVIEKRDQFEIDLRSLK